MYEWNEEQIMVRDSVRKFIEKEIKPALHDLEHGDMPPYDIIRKFLKAFGLDEMAREDFKTRIENEKKAEEARARGEEVPPPKRRESGGAALGLIPTMELCRYCPGLVTAMGVSRGLTPAAIMSRGTIAQKERWALQLLTMEKVGAWAITEPDAGSDAFGSMKATAKRDGDGYVLNGSKTFITNGPYADTTVFICKLDEGNPPKERKILSFVLDKGMPGLEQTKPLQKMGMHSSPTGEVFVTDMRVGIDRLIGEKEVVSAGGGREAARATFQAERTGIATMALGIIQQCLDLSVDYAKQRVQFGQPIGAFQLIQLKLAKMEVARFNVENMVFRSIEMQENGKSLTLPEASAMKLYAAQAATEVALEAVQIFGGNGYMSEFQVEQLARDAKALQIYGGTDEMQTAQIARGLLRG